MEWEVEADYQIELINCIYAITPEEVEVQYSLGASFSAVSGSKNKIMGFHSGWPDLTIAWKNKGICFLELKAKSGKLSDSQKECHAWLRLCDFEVNTTKTIENGLNFLVTCGAPLKNRYQSLFVYSDESRQKCLILP